MLDVGEAFNMVNQFKIRDKSQYQGLLKRRDRDEVLVYPTRLVLIERLWCKGKKTKISWNKSLKFERKKVFQSPN